MKDFYKNISNFKLPNKKDLNSAFLYFSKREWFIFISLTIVCIFSLLVILGKINSSFMIPVPAHGGSISEGQVGTPRFINPILAFSDVDQNLASLVYSGLMRKNSQGNLIPDLAEKYEISKNNLVYTFTLKDNLYFQDKKPLSTDDIIFTINKAKDPIIKSPQKANWDGVTIEKIDSKNIKFTLKKPYASFLENTTLGILPMHIWDGSPIELNNANISPIGSGPYMVKSSNKLPSGIIDYYNLVPFDKFILGKAYIQNINLHFYQNEEEMIKALKDKTIKETSSINPENAEILKNENYDIEASVLPRVFGLFFNQNANHLFLDKTVIKVINEAVNKEEIVKNVLASYGNVIDNPIPANMIAYQNLNRIDKISHEKAIEQAQKDLEKDGWKKGSDGILEKSTKNKKKVTTTKLEFSISTGNVKELVQTAEIIKKNLTPLGIKVDIKTFETGNLNQNVIRPRKYETLLFGEIVNRESDLFAFWHSTQRKDPGLNVAMYTNAKVDKILADAFITSDEQARVKKYLQFEDEIRKDMPAVFLYSPQFVYVVSKDLKNFKVREIIYPKDRYTNIYTWYINTENIWKIFSPK